MSGPIVRRYGFPNFEKIFGERELKHGGEEATEPSSTSPTPPEPAKPAPGSSKPSTESDPSKS